MTRVWFALLSGWLAIAGAAGAAENDTRFSLALNVNERTEAGINHLSSDQVAVLDALVRRDVTARAATTADPAAPANFSQRLSADERRISGLTLLTTTELPRLDALVDRLESGTLARTLLAPPVFLARVAPVETAETKKAREIHGSISMSYGWGGGYSEKSASMTMNFADPDGHYFISAGYSETHVTAPSGNR